MATSDALDLLPVLLLATSPTSLSVHCFGHVWAVLPHADDDILIRQEGAAVVCTPVGFPLRSSALGLDKCVP